jgi:tetratricopeptide (TPR) repeat protein
MLNQINSVIIEPYVSYWGMYKSRRVLEVILAYYFPLYKLTNKEFFTCYPVLGFVESLIYQADEAVELIQAEKALSYQEKPWNQRFRTIINLLKELKLYHLSIEKELYKLGEYYELENYLMSQGLVTHADIIKASELRTSDTRTLHRILLQIFNKPYNEDYFNLMWYLEVLGDIFDDIESYKDDVEKDHYNTYRMFVKLYGEKAPDYLRIEIKRYLSLFRERLTKLPEDEQAIYRKIASVYKQEHSIDTIPEPIIE